MTDSKNRQWILNARPAGKLTGEEFLWNEAPIPSDGQVLIRTLWLSVDPAQRIWMARDSYKPAVPLGDVMQSFAVGQVIESRHPAFKPGALLSVGMSSKVVNCQLGRTHTYGDIREGGVAHDDTIESCVQFSLDTPSSALA